MNCPACSSSSTQHTWRTDMTTLSIHDDYRCLLCEHRWQDELTYAELTEMSRDELRETRRLAK